MSAPRRILLVEDSPTERLLTQASLERSPAGFSVTAVETAEEALERLRNEKFDLLVVDHHLPGQCGLDLLEALRDFGDTTPALYLTSELDRDVIQRALSLGVHHYLPKDTNARMLLPLLAERTLDLDRIRREREVALTQLEANEATYRSLVDSTVDLMFQVGPELSVRFANPAFEARLGIGTSELVDTPESLVRLVAHSDQARVVALLADVFASPDSGIAAQELEAAMVTSDGSTRQYQWRLHLRRTRVSGPVLDIVARDVTRERELTRALEQEKSNLVLINDKLQRLSQIKSIFLSKMSHELKTPMNTILGYTECLLEEIDGPLTQRQVESLERVRRNGRRLMAMIGDLLDLSRLETQEIGLHLTEFALIDLLRHTLEEFRTQLSAQTVMRLSCPLDLRVLADHTLLSQALGHLVHNAVRFTQAGEIRLEAFLDPATTGMIHVAIVDTGPGIPAESLNVVFEPFRQGEDSLNRSHDGSGLGLPLADRLVRLHRGHIEVESRPGVGSTFRLVLPIGVAGVDSHDSGSTAAAYRASHVGVPLVLTVTGDPDSLALVERLARQAGLESFCVHSVQEAIEAVPRLVPRAVLVDPGAPGSGDESNMQTLAAQCGALGITVVDLGQTQGARGATRPMRIQVLEKPFPPAQLAARLRQVNGGSVPQDVVIQEEDDALRSLHMMMLQQSGVPVVRQSEDHGQTCAHIDQRVPEAVIVDMIVSGEEALKRLRHLCSLDPEGQMPVLVITSHDLAMDGLDDLVRPVGGGLAPKGLALTNLLRGLADQGAPPHAPPTSR